MSIDLKEIEFRFIEEFVYEHATFVSMIYNGKNFFDDFFLGLSETLQQSLIKKMEIIGNTKRSNWNPDIIETIGKKNYPKQFCIRKLKKNNFRVSVTTINLDGDIIVLILGFPKSSDQSTKKIHQFYKKAQQYVDVIQENQNEIRIKLRKIIR